MRQLRPLVILAIVTSLFNFFACSGQTGQDNANAPADTLDSESVQDFMNRPIYKELTEDIIDTTPDDQLLQTVFDNLAEKIPQDYSKEYETVLTFTKAQQAIYVIQCLEAEVDNGGFNQFYFNSSGKFAKLVPDALRLIKANKFADLVTMANETYERKKTIITKDQDGTLEGFSKSYNNNPLSGFDDKFYNLEKIEDLQQLQINFIRSNKTDFTDE